jgi:hypothetical protein
MLNCYSLNNLALCNLVPASLEQSSFGWSIDGYQQENDPDCLNHVLPSYQVVLDASLAVHHHSPYCDLDKHLMAHIEHKTGLLWGVGEFAVAGHDVAG